MSVPFSRCLAVDPYYLSTMETIALPWRFRDRLSPYHAARYHQAFEAIRANNHPEALAILARLETEAHGADSGLFPATAALVLCVGGNPTMAEYELERALKTAPDCGEYHHLAGVLAVRRRDLAKAEACFRKAARLAPDLGQAWAALALLLILDEQWAEAEQPARRALALGCELGANLVTYGLMFATLLQNRPVESPFLLPPAGAIPDATMDRLLSGLPAVEGDTPPAGETGPLIFVACDTTYLTRHALDLLWSLDETGVDGQVHLHIFNPSGQDIQTIKATAKRLQRIRLGHSCETVDLERFGPAPVYYSSARFCRFYQLVRATKRPALILDADSLFRLPPHRLPGWGRADLDLALMENPTGPPWERFLACGLYAAPTPAGLDYLARVAFFVGQNLIARKGRWFLDQIALFLAHRQAGSALRLRSWNADCFDLGHRDHSVVWTVALNKSQDGRYMEFKRNLVKAQADRHPAR